MIAFMRMSLYFLAGYRKRGEAMGYGHGHGHLPAQGGSASGRYVASLAAALALGAVVMVVEFGVGFATSSLALISDAAHMLTDVLGIAMALAAVHLARRSGPTFTRTFGMYRAEVLAALANAVLLFGVAGYVVYEAVDRITDPPEVPGLPVLLVAALGLAANVVAFLLLRRGAQESLNVRGAYLEVLADLVGSIGVLVSGALTLTTGWRYADPVIGVVIGLFVLPRTAVLARRALRILFQHAPHGVDVAALNGDLHRLPGVEDVHDLHVWTLTSGMEVASAHLTVDADSDPAEVLSSAQQLLASRYTIEHATLQVEPRESALRCARLTW
ncbi:cation diffusion facilitator family transporter [Saccharomonospora xinjiangensis XJ-54]|uniref:Cation diffusion facilitator family transporter n=2 Tax=Saccharomonospora TaxID=1851 RepID=I0V5F3_9PSEU|nr:cation diffusion facilitator family transporter [Saccharomonospora xinjiangensis XJ-54]